MSASMPIGRTRVEEGREAGEARARRIGKRFAFPGAEFLRAHAPSPQTRQGARRTGARPVKPRAMALVVETHDVE